MADKPLLIGMIHLPPLPGSPFEPANAPNLRDHIKPAIEDAKALRDAGFNALLIENYGDAPFHANRVEPVTVACMALAADAVREATGLPFGINVLRNDALAALGIAVATGASFIRVNVHVGVAATDQGFIEGRASETIREQRRLQAIKLAIYADVHVKHAVQLDQPDIAQAARDVCERGRAAGVIVTGDATGCPPDVKAVQRVRDAVQHGPVLVGSGVNADNVREYLQFANGAIVGTSIKYDGRTENRVDPQRSAAFVRAATTR